MTDRQGEEAASGALKTLDGGSGQMFDAIAGRYDFVNRVLSLGQDQYWRRKAVRALELKEGDLALDVATGTADLAIMIARRHQGVRVDGVDPSVKMIERGRRKVASGGLDERVELSIGDGLALPYDDDAYDGATIAFGIRNFPDRLQGLREMARVVRPGRKVVVLELSEPRRGALAYAARAYVHHIVPAIGAALSGKKEYRYLQESIEAFPSAEDFSRLMERAGFIDVRVKPLSFGAVNLFVGTVERAV